MSDRCGGDDDDGGDGTDCRPCPAVAGGAHGGGAAAVGGRAGCGIATRTRTTAAAAVAGNAGRPDEKTQLLRMKRWPAAAADGTDRILRRQL